MVYNGLELKKLVFDLGLDLTLRARGALLKLFGSNRYSSFFICTRFYCDRNFDINGDFYYRWLLRSVYSFVFFQQLRIITMFLYRSLSYHCGTLITILVRCKGLVLKGDTMFFLGLASYLVGTRSFGLLTLYAKGLGVLVRLVGDVLFKRLTTIDLYGYRLLLLRDSLVRYKSLTLFLNVFLYGRLVGALKYRVRVRRCYLGGARCTLRGPMSAGAYKMIGYGPRKRRKRAMGRGLRTTLYVDLALLL